ncbi:hypothetical protein X975_19644, partial [Stegodyphus mimosarum]
VIRRKACFRSGAGCTDSKYSSKGLMHYILIDR